MKQYTNKEMADMNDEKWLVVNGVEPKINMNLRVDIVLFSDHGIPHLGSEGLGVCTLNWENIAKYRLHNSPGYKDGIAIEKKLTPMNYSNPMQSGKVAFLEGLELNDNPVDGRTGANNKFLWEEGYKKAWGAEPGMAV